MGYLGPGQSHQSPDVWFGVGVTRRDGPCKRRLRLGAASWVTDSGLGDGLPGCRADLSSAPCPSLPTEADSGGQSA